MITTEASGSVTEDREPAVVVGGVIAGVVVEVVVAGADDAAVDGRVDDEGEPMVVEVLTVGLAEVEAGVDEVAPTDVVSSALQAVTSSVINAVCDVAAAARVAAGPCGTALVELPPRPAEPP